MDQNLLSDIRDRIGPSHMGRAALIGLVVVLAVIIAIAATKLIGTASAREFEVSSSSQSSAVSSSAAASKTVFVHVTGAVCNPGLYEVTEGARVAEAIQEAGGFADEAAVDSINLARVVSDGEQIVVAKLASAADESGDAPASIQQTQGSSATTLININTASESELESLPGIGASTASKIASDRKANGSFKTIEDLKRVSGIGDKKFESLKDLICV